MAGFIDIHDIGQIGTIFGIMAILISTFFQLRSYKKQQKEDAEKNREAITREINDKTAILFERVEGRLEAIKIAALVTTEDITELKKQLDGLRTYVNELDKSGGTEWKTSKPFIMEKIDTLQKSIEELEQRISNFKIRKERIENDIKQQQNN